MELLEDRRVLSALTWSAGIALPAARSSDVAVLANDHSLLVLGGNTTAVNDLPYNGAAWTAENPLPSTISGGGVASIGGSELLVYGGSGVDGSVNSAFTYDPVNASNIASAASMANSRRLLAFATDDSHRAYAIGGINDSGENPVILTSVERFDPSTGTWSELSGLPQATSGAAAVYDGAGDILVFGGATSSAKATTAALEYTISTGVWSTLTSMPTATTEAAAVLGTDGSIYVLGGKTASGKAQATVQIYNPSTGVWTAGTSLPTALSDEAAVSDALGQIEVIGGRNSQGSAVSTVYVSPVLANVAPVITTTSLPSATAGVAYTATVAATGTPPPTYSVVAPVPAGLSIDPNSGLISWLPTTSQIGTQPVTIQASNLAATVSQTISLVVTPDITPPSAPTLSVGTITSTTSIPLSWTTATDNVGVAGYRIFLYTPAVYKGHSGRDGGITLVSPAKYTLLVDNLTTTSYTLTGLTPNTTYQFAVAAFDAAGNQSPYSGLVTGTTLLAPSITYYINGATNPAVTVVANHPLNLSVYASGDPAPTLSMVSAPSGVAYGLSSLTWTPTADEVGVSHITMQATNSVGTATLVIPVTVTADVAVPSLTINGGYAYGVGNMTTVAGSPFQYQLTANPGFNNDNPVGPTPQYAMVGTPFAFQFTGTSNTNPTTYAIVSGPATMTLDPNTGVGAWIPQASDAAAATSVTLSATNSAGTSLLTFTFPTYFTTAPTNVAVVYHTNVSNSALPPDVTWTAPANSASVADYKIAVTDANTNVVTVYDTGSTGTSYILTGINAAQKFVTVTAYDANGNPSVASTSVSFDLAGMPNLSWTLSSPSATVGQVFSVPFSPGSGYYSYSIASGPSGVSINASTGLLTWTPMLADVGTDNIVVAATNGWGVVYATLTVPVTLTSAQVTSSQTANSLTIASGQEVAVAAGAALAITTDTSVTAGGILSIDPNGAFSTGGTLTVDSGGSVSGGSVTAAAFQFNDGTVSANLSGPGGLTKGGAGSATLSGTNTYGGGTSVLSGTLNVAGANALPGGSNLTVGFGAASFFAPTTAASASPAGAGAAASSAIATPVPAPITGVSHTAAVAKVSGGGASIHAALLQHFGGTAVKTLSSPPYAAELAWLASLQSGDAGQKHASLQALDALLAQYGA
jgi:autotransporter-associated beta strand protein